jgi:hypothetical protein
VPDNPLRRALVFVNLPLASGTDENKGETEKITGVCFAP